MDELSSQMSQNESDDDDVSEQAIEEDETMQSPIQSPPEQFDHFDSAPSSVASSTTPVTKNRRKRLIKDDTSIGQALLQVEQQKFKLLEQKNKKNNEDEADLDFFKSLLPHVRTLSPYDKLEYRMRVMKLTQEFVQPSGENTLNFNEASTSSAGQQNTARRFYNSAERLLNLSGESQLFNPLNSLPENI